MVAARKDPQLTYERLVEVLDYCPATGVFTWKKTLSPRGVMGAQAGSVKPSGYRVIHVDSWNYMAQRLAWLYFYGFWPTHFVDHENRMRDDNRITNLRDVPQLLNRHNTEAASSRNKSGFLGVVETKKGRFRARITYPGKKNHYLGTFDTPEEAHAAFMAAKAKYHEGALP